MTPDAALIAILALCGLWAAIRERRQWLIEDIFERERMNYGHAPSPIPQPAMAGEIVLSRQRSAAVAAQLRGTALWERLRAVEIHDFRDMGNPLEKVYPITDWRAWERRT